MKDRVVLLIGLAALITALTAATSCGDAMSSPPADLMEGRNRLGDETSPYLLQHRDNPVHWWPWGHDAFAAARALDRPIFLSIGYSTCYWCHVMERESFENEAIARVMNEHFICIKVDREERPDVDDIYMTAVQAMTGSGGWPMSVFLEPRSLKPFLAGTYFPPQDRYGRPGFRSVLQQVAQYWTQQRDAVIQQADRVAEAVAQHLSLADQPQPPGTEPIEAAVTQLLSLYDRAHGGFGRGPNKFPTPVNIDFLMTAAWDRPAARDAVLHTLDRMATGGMYDQIGGGFHRYSTDAEWLVPHFEKMLYDNGQLASTYAEAHQRTGDPYYAEIVRETLDYVLREMTSRDGAFFSAQDAEVNHREGGNYIWTAEQVGDVLRGAGLADDVEFALEVYGFNAGPNFTDPHHPGDGAKNVVHLVEKPETLAVKMDLPLEEFNTCLKRINEGLLAARDRRDQPLTDDKILAGWNGLMIAGMADGGRVLGEARYIDAARRAARFVLETMRTPDGGLLRTARQGRAKIDAFLEDYAFMIRGLLALHRATGERGPRDQAIELARIAKRRFLDESTGSYFDTLADQSDLFVRTKSTYDGATPSGNGVMAHNLLELHALTGDETCLDEAAALLGALGRVLTSRPLGSVTSLSALSRLAEVSPEHLERPRTPAGEVDEPQPVQVTADRDAVTLAVDESAAVTLTIRIADGYHINAHEPGLDGLIPLEVKLIDGAGLEFAVDYPPGEPIDGPVGRARVHHGVTTLPITLTRVGDITGRPAITVTCQACTDTACLEPQRVTLPVEIGGG
ncbi:MAG: DUF255 domain-containing protein [Planctomycetota bacterium]|nr:DUF255 domain-containing protein [Planctomycetota bacterium]